MRKFIIFVLLLLCLFPLENALAEGVELYIFGNAIECDVPPVIEDGRTLVPIRAVVENSLGANVEWNPENRVITIAKDDISMVLMVDSAEAYVNGELIMLDVPAKIMDGRTMVPVRFISEALEYNVSWDSANSRVLIEYIGMDYIKDISVETAEHDTVVNFEVSNMRAPDIFILTDPYRIVADFESFAFEGVSTGVEVNSPNVNVVRWARHDAFYRVVIDCNGEQKYRYVQTGENTFGIVVYNPEDYPVDPAHNQYMGGTTDTENTADDFKVIPPVSTNKLVVLDPGHGGKDPGALGRDPQGNVIYDISGKIYLEEKDINLSVARRVYEYLTNGGINVIMTHSDDSFVELRSIADFANSSNAALFVSIHSNSVDSIPTANGTEVLYYDTDYKGAYGINSSALANNILKEMMKVSGTTNRGLKERPGLAVMKWTNMPSALVELGFVTNAGDIEKLKDPQWQDKVAAAIARGIEISLQYVN